MESFVGWRVFSEVHTTQTYFVNINKFLKYSERFYQGQKIIFEIELRLRQLLGIAPEKIESYKHGPNFKKEKKSLKK